MESGNRPIKLRSFGEYFSKSIKFYQLKNEVIARFVFLVILITGIIELVLPENVYLLSIYGVIRLTIVHIASTIYLYAYLLQLKGETSDTKDCIKDVIKRVPAIMISSVSFILSLIMLLGLIISPEEAYYIIGITGIPVLVLYLVYFFNVCIIVDKKKGVLDSYSLGRKMTRGYKWKITKYLLAIYILLSFPLTFILLPVYLANSSIANAFVILFISTIIGLIQQRLTVLLYIDINYGKGVLVNDKTDSGNTNG